MLGIDIAKKEKFNALHFLVFLGIGIGLLVFTFFPSALTALGNIFWLQRGADLLVYLSIVFLLYFVLLLLRKIESSKSDITRLMRELAIENSRKTKLWKKEVFVIPAYNEWTVIQEILQEIIDFGIEDIIVVNDGSTDNTRDVLGWFWDNIITLHHYDNRGQWAALETGFEYVRRFWWKYGWVVTFDSDGQHDLDDIKVFRSSIDTETDILLGSRFLKKSSTNISVSRKFLLKLAIVFTFFLSHIRLSDTHNWFRYFKKSCLNDIYISIDGMWHASEIIDIISRKNMKFREVPISIKYTKYSTKKWQKNRNFVSVFFRVIWSKFFK